MNSKFLTELGIGATCIGMGILYWSLAPEVPDMGYGVPPQIYEKLLSFFLVFCGVIELARSLRLLNKPAPEGPSQKHPFRWLNLVFLLSITVAYLSFFDYAGFIVSSSIASALVLLVFGERRPHVIVLLPCLFTILLYYLFHNLMGVLLPGAMFS